MLLSAEGAAAGGRAGSRPAEAQRPMVTRRVAAGGKPAATVGLRQAVAGENFRMRGVVGQCRLLLRGTQVWDRRAAAAMASVVFKCTSCSCRYAPMMVESGHTDFRHARTIVPGTPRPGRAPPPLDLSAVYVGFKYYMSE